MRFSPEDEGHDKADGHMDRALQHHPQEGVLDGFNKILILKYRDKISKPLEPGLYGDAVLAERGVENGHDGRRIHDAEVSKPLHLALLFCPFSRI